MSIRLTTFRGLFFFLAILSLVLSFPMQVYIGSPYPALLPYFFTALAILGGAFAPRRAAFHAVQVRAASTSMSIMIMLYVFLVLMHTAWQTALGVVNFKEGLSALVVYLFPVIYYIYFRRVATEKEIRWVFVAMVVAGIIVSAYYVYDSYLKLALGVLNDYAVAAFQYSLDRSNQTIDDANRARISLAYRSYGLLQAPSISAAWVIIAAFAALVFVPPRRRILRQAVLILCGATLLVALNFTSIVAFAVIIFAFEFSGFFLLDSATFKKLGLFAFFVTGLFGAALWIGGDPMIDFVLENLTYARDLAFGTGDLGFSMAGLLAEYSGVYAEYVAQSPQVLLVGDGFSTFGMSKGGDIGFIESLARFGMPYFLAVLLGFLSLITKGLTFMRRVQRGPRLLPADCERASKIQFVVCLVLLILIAEGHYSIWIAKSILPILFFALALYERYLVTSVNILRIVRRDRDSVTADQAKALQAGGIA